MINQKELAALVPSVDVRKFVLDTGYTFTDWQKATLLFHNSIRLKEKFSYFKELMEHTADEKLKEQIADYLSYEDKKICEFKVNSGRDFFYQIFYMNEDTEKKIYFSDFETAWKHGKDTGVSFHIEKYPIVSVEMNEVLWVNFQNGRYSSISAIYFDETGEAYDIWSSEPSSYQTEYDYEEYGHFGFDFYEVPNPFERGDIVKYVDRNEFGIVELSQKEWKAYLERNLDKEREFISDYSDVQIRVVFLQNDGTFVHDHVNPVSLEYYQTEWNGKYDTEEETRNALLVLTGALYKGTGSVEELFWLSDVYKRFQEKS